MLAWFQGTGCLFQMGGCDPRPLKRRHLSDRGLLCPERSHVASTAVLASLMVPEMMRRRYDKEMILGLISGFWGS
jgi:hypothetical protein